MGASTEEATALWPYPYAHRTNLVMIETPYERRPNWSHCKPEDQLGLGLMDGTHPHPRTNSFGSKPDAEPSESKSRGNRRLAGQRPQRQRTCRKAQQA